MIKRYKKMIALCATLTFLTLLPVYSAPRPAESAQDQGVAANADQAPNFVEKEQQAGYQVTSRNVLPVILGFAAVAAGIFLLVILVTKTKYDITGTWDFHHDYTTAGQTDFDSVWTFTTYEAYYDKAMGRYSRNAGGAITEGEYTVVNKKEVVFQDDWMTEQYTGQFDSKTTMSGTFVLATGVQGNWTAVKR